MIATRTGIADVLVIDDGGSPDWLLGWCRRSGRQMREIALPQPSGADLLTIADLVVTEAHNGTAVLVARPQPVVARAPRVVAALRDLPDDADVLALAAENAAHMGATLTVAHAVPASFGERSIGLSSALERGWRLLASVWPPSTTPSPSNPGSCACTRTSSSVRSSTPTFSSSAAHAREEDSGSWLAARCSTHRALCCSSPARHACTRASASERAPTS